MKHALKERLSRLGLLECARQVRRAATTLYRRAQGCDLRLEENYVAVRRDAREIRISAEVGCNSLSTIIENFDYIHSAVLPKTMKSVAVADFSHRQTHRFRRSGAEVELSFDSERLSIRKDNREIRLHPSHIIYVWDLADVLFDHDHSAVVAEMQNGVAVADYSQPRVHRLTRSGLEFTFPSVPESDESAEAYVKALQLKPADVVLDLGAYAGLSAYFLSHAVGPEGTVGCFEPDETTFRYLEANLARHGLGNVKAFKKGIWTETTTLAFQAEGNMGSALVAVLGRKTNAKPIEVVSLEDAAALLGTERIAAVKMDVEGAEVDILRSAGDFLRRHKPAFVVEPHPIAGKMNTQEICDIFRAFDYSADLISQGAEDWPLVLAKPR